jgi:hypothetical protein
MMKSIRSSETSVLTRATLRHIPEDEIPLLLFVYEQMLYKQSHENHNRAQKGHRLAAIQYSRDLIKVNAKCIIIISTALGNFPMFLICLSFQLTCSCCEASFGCRVLHSLPSMQRRHGRAADARSTSEHWPPAFSCGY